MPKEEAWCKKLKNPDRENILLAFVKTRVYSAVAIASSYCEFDTLPLFGTFLLITCAPCREENDTVASREVIEEQILRNLTRNYCELLRTFAFSFSLFFDLFVKAILCCLPRGPSDLQRRCECPGSARCPGAGPRRD